MNIVATRLQLVREMRTVIVTHLALYTLLLSAFLAHQHSNAVLAAITANTAVMGERVWAVQKRAMFVWHPWVQRAFVASRSLIMGIYAGTALMWGVHAFGRRFQ